MHNIKSYNLNSFVQEVALRDHIDVIEHFIQSGCLTLPL